jgi:hypothetical protein
MYSEPRMQWSLDRGAVCTIEASRERTFCDISFEVNTFVQHYERTTVIKVQKIQSKKTRDRTRAGSGMEMQ